MEVYDFFGNRLWDVVIPTQPPIRFGLSPFYPIPPVGGEFLLNFSAIFEEEENLGRINDLIENGDLRVEEIDDKTVILHHGALPGIAPPDASLYMNEYYKYWYSHEEYSPIKEFPDPDMGTRSLVITGKHEITFQVPFLYPVPMPGGQLEINYDKVLGPTDLNYVKKLTENQPLYCYKVSAGKIWFQPGPPLGIKSNFNQSEQNKQYAFYWTRNPDFAPNYWRKEPFVLTYPGKHLLHIEIPGGQRIFLPGLNYQIDWKRFISSHDWDRIKEELDEDGRYADKWMDTPHLKIKRLRLDELGESDGRFDVVMLHHSFEHLEDPQQAFSKIADILKPGGRALFRLPVTDGIVWKKELEFWFQLDAPRHLFIPSVKGMEILGNTVGLTLEKLEFDSIGKQFWIT